jgi:hypothetical protein
MLKALHDQEQMPDIERLGFLERLGLLVDREIQERDNRRLTTRLGGFKSEVQHLKPSKVNR